MVRQPFRSRAGEEKTVDLCWPRYAHHDVRRKPMHAGRRKLLRRTVALAAGLAVTGASPRRAAATERDVAFTGHGGVTLAGSLMLPRSADSAGPVPALLLIQGSGPTDRNGNQPPTLISDLL